MILQADQSLFIITGQHTFAGGKINRFGEIVRLDDAHTVQFGLLDDVRIVGTVGQDKILMVGEYGEIVVERFLIKVGNPFRGNALFKEQFAIFCLDDLPSVVGENIASELVQFQFLGNWHDSVGRSPGRQNNMNAHVLSFQQRGQGMRRNLLLAVEECPIHI